jgi:NAD(P)-dependent dehydrogenase (short-subunit alcohol dehydrogenase family)
VAWAATLQKLCSHQMIASWQRLAIPGTSKTRTKQHGDHVRAVTPDVTDEGAAQAAVRAAVDTFGRLDVLVNNAGYGDVAPFEQLSSERFKAVMDTNFYGVVYVTRAALAIMRRQKSGCILQISSLGGRLGLPGSSAYYAAKWAVGGFTESLVQEVAPFGVKVCALEPGGMRTNWGLALTDTCLICYRITSRPSAPRSGHCTVCGAMRIAIRQKSLKSFFAWQPVIDCRHIT